MRMILPVIVLGLAISMGFAKEKESPQKGDVFYLPAVISVAVSPGTLINQPIPYERLDCKYTSHCSYKIPICGPLTVTKFVPKKNLLHLNVFPEGYINLSMNGKWRQYLQTSKKECFLKFGPETTEKFELDSSDGILTVLLRKESLHSE